MGGLGPSALDHADEQGLEAQVGDLLGAGQAKQVQVALTLVGLTLVWWVPIGAALLSHGWQRLCGLAAFVWLTLPVLAAGVRGLRAAASSPPTGW